MDMSNTPRTYRLGSSQLVYAPGLIKWAMNGYRFERDRERMIDVVRTAYTGLPKPAVAALLSGTVPHAVEADAVVFTA